MDAAATMGIADLSHAGKMSEKEFHDQLAHTEPVITVGDGGRTSLAEYMYWAKRQRAIEDADTTVVHSAGLGKLFAQRKGKHVDSAQTTISSAQEGGAADLGVEGELVGLSLRDTELANARRVLRQAGWATVFYLITCDILGPFNAPYAIAQVGYVPGVTLYVLFGAMAGLTGVMLQRMFLQLDSVRFPVKTYGDLADRVFGSWARHFCSILQAVQLILNCGIITLSNGQGVSQIAKGNICFSVAIVIWAFVGMILGQIRGLQKFSILANASVWLNILIIILSMGFIAHSPPNIAAAMSTYGSSLQLGKVVSQAVVPLPIFTQVTGVFNMVFAYGGAMIFPEVMSEMRRPRDFIKGMAIAQILIFCVYLIYGVYVYALQGQYTLPLAYQGVSKYSWQNVGNVIALITGCIAAGLYGNIGIKVFYVNIIEDLFKGPPLMSRGGRILWSLTVLVWWSVAFVIGTAIPGVGALSGLVAAVCIFQFTYTFPPLLMLGLQMGVDAAMADEPFTTPGVRPERVDSWRQASRWKRGLTAGGPRRLIIKLLNLLFLLGGLATAGLGMWATGTALRETLAAGAASSFGCTAPV